MMLTSIIFFCEATQIYIYSHLKNILLTDVKKKKATFLNPDSSFTVVFGKCLLFSSCPGKAIQF